MKGFFKQRKSSTQPSDFVVPKEEQIRKEFEELTRKKDNGPGKPQTVGALEENQPKNRYHNVLPYDATRVKLKDPKRDYINANHITFKGFSEKYIAASAPPKAAICDFWSMVYEKRCTSIIMLTNELEMGKLKCDRYWPPREKSILYGEIAVRLLEEHKFEHFTWRLLVVVHQKQKKGFKCRQYHFTSWPDFDVPTSPKPLIAMMLHVKEWNTSNKTQLVHCSAGVGRTGTYCVLDVARKDLSKGRQPSVFKLVEEMREQRAGMVQSYEQYAFCYKALATSYSTVEIEAEYEQLEEWIAVINPGEGEEELDDKDSDKKDAGSSD